MFPFSEQNPICFSGPVPGVTDFVVIGGGVIGVSAALFLARKGLRVVLLEKGRIAGEQSSRNWGWIRQQGRDPHELAIMVEAHRLWTDLAAETDVDIGLKTLGVTYLAKTDKEMAQFDAWQPYASANGVETQLWDRSGLSADVRAAGYVGAMHTPSDMKAEPWVAVPALARLAERAGAVVAEGCAARALDIEAGRITGVITEQGWIKTSGVILAGGAWSSLFLRRHGVTIPQLSVRASVAATDPLSLPDADARAGDKFAFRARSDGGVTLAPGGFHELFVGPDAFRALPKFIRQFASDPLGTRFFPAAPKHYPDAWGTSRNWAADEISPFEKMRILNPSPNLRKLREAANGLEALHPSIGPVTFRTTWAGMIDVMPDVVPVIDHASSIQGLTIGTGMCGHGFGIGPGFGRVLADLASGGNVGHDLHRFRLARFSDGSKMDPGPGL